MHQHERAHTVKDLPLRHVNSTCRPIRIPFASPASKQRVQIRQHTLKTSKVAFELKPGSLYAAVRRAVLSVCRAFSSTAAPFAGWRVVARSTLRPFANESASSTRVLSLLSCVQDCVNVSPFLRSAYLASPSAVIAPDDAARPLTRNVTPFGVVVFTSSWLPLIG